MLVPDVRVRDLLIAYMVIPICSCCQPIEANSVTSEDPRDGGSVCCCYDYSIDVRLQNCVVRCVLRVIGCANPTNVKQNESTHKMVAARKRLTASNATRVLL